MMTSCPRELRKDLNQHFVLSATKCRQMSIANSIMMCGYVVDSSSEGTPDSQKEWRRKPVRDTTLHERHNALNAGETAFMRKIHDQWNQVLNEIDELEEIQHILHDESSHSSSSSWEDLQEEIQDLEDEAEEFMEIDIAVCQRVGIERRTIPTKNYRSFALLDERWVHNNLRFTKDNLLKMFQKLDLPLEVRPGNDHFFTDEETFIMCWCHMTKGATFVVMASDVFGGDSR